MAGLGAAQLLKRAGGYQVKIVEARDRIGGRVHTCPFGKSYKDGVSDIVTDLGASWIHGRGPGAYDLQTWKGQLNPIYELAKDRNVETVVTWEGDRDPELQELYWYKGGKAPFSIFETI